MTYGVFSLFTSIPLKETTDITLNLLLKHNADLKITKVKLKKLFEFATSGTHFIFQRKFHDQINGMALLVFSRWSCRD